MRQFRSRFSKICFQEGMITFISVYSLEEVLTLDAFIWYDTGRRVATQATAPETSCWFCEEES